MHGAHGARLLGAALTAAECGQPLPINGETPRTENESGCICHGAVLTAAAAVPAVDWHCWCFDLDLQPAGWPASHPLAIAASPFDSHPPDAPARITGKILRAWIASLVI
ncbi:MAG TPA: hypothetical protein VG433_15315 [Pirellulales bacterium]|jgi:hypothetical protein|nr:hypothetical protein [Pirellulales bacterium]